ncbi:transcriptional regulator QRICH1-like [Ylistrum balloti]|uniref:transcriptional regulator QRICH1-like n=1 Tax=Ylistrum balloti TaxID=509963 RepID=UPI002905E45C|nr:transcriptional regulator QRICH1-like [Ylistrum balloti]
MADQINIGDTVFIDKKGTGVVKEIIPRGFAVFYDVELRGIDFQIQLERDRIEKVVREVLKGKQRQLKREGKGNLAHKSDPINDNEIDILWNSGELGSDTPDSILQTVWFYNTIHFGLRGSAEHRHMCWGDVSLWKDEDWHECLDFTERQLKICTGENVRDIRSVKPKLRENLENPNRCPVLIYKLYREKRPVGYSGPSDPFYLATKQMPSQNDKTWLKKQPVGVNKLCTMMQRMVKSSGITTEKRLSNHSARKYLVQKLSDSNIIMQISGHKNISSTTTATLTTTNTNRSRGF